MSKMRIGVVAPSCRIDLELAERVRAVAGESCDIVFHPQCFLSHGHFAGPDAARADAFVEVANDPAIDVVWFARGGYGSCRIIDLALPRLGETARAKVWLGYSDGGSMLGALYAAGFGGVAHGPMPADLKRTGGRAAVKRALDWLVNRSAEAIEPSISDAPAAAFNITILAHLIGTPHQPDLTGHVLMLEEVSEYMYRIDRSLCHITSNPGIRGVAGIRLGRCSQIPENDVDFGENEEEVARHWCEVSRIAWLGRADIGHDVGNKVVPFGR